MSNTSASVNASESRFAAAPHRNTGLPAGITLGSGGASGVALLSGTPVTSGTYNFTITVTDSSATQLMGSTAYSITIQ